MSKSHMTSEDLFVISAQDMLVGRRSGPGRVIDTSGTFDEFSARMFALRDKRKSENEAKR